MLSFNDKISIRQLQILLIIDILGTGVIILPRRVAEFAAQDGWFVILCSTLLAMLFTYLIGTIGGMFPADSFLTYCAKIMTKPVAILISLAFVFKILVNIAMELRFFAEIINQTMLFKTPFLAIYASIVAVSAYAAAKGYETRARIAEILLPLIFIPLTIVFALATLDVDFSNLLPVLRSQPQSIARGTFFTTISFTGVEFLLLVHPYLNRPKKARAAAVRTIGFIGVCMTLITVITIAKFGPLDVCKQMWPVLEMMDVIDLPGAFIERQDALILSFWIVSIFAIVNAGLFFASIMLKDIYPKIKHSTYIFLCAPVVILAAYVPKNISQVYQIMDFMFISFGILFMFVVPFVLIIVAKLRKLGEKL